MSTDTYFKGKKILDANNAALKQEVLSGEKSINAGYKELTQSKEGRNAPYKLAYKTPCRAFISAGFRFLYAG